MHHVRFAPDASLHLRTTALRASNTDHTLRPVDALLRTDTGSWCVRKARPLLLPLIVMLAPLQASLLVAFSALKVAFKGVLMGTQAVYQESVVNN